MNILPRLEGYEVMGACFEVYREKTPAFSKRFTPKAAIRAHRDLISCSCASCISWSEPKVLKSVLHLLEMEIERAEFLQLARFEMSGNLGVGLELLDKIGVVASGMLHFPGFHRVALH